MNLPISLHPFRESCCLSVILCFCFATVQLSAQNALDFDGGNDVVQTTYSGVLGSADRTFEAWVNVPSNAPSSNMAIMDYGVNAVGSRNSFSVTPNLGLTFVSGGTNANMSSTANVIPVGQWTHVAFVLDNGTGFMYVNGTQVGTGNLTTVNTPTGNANMTIGQRVSGGNIPFQGGIDEVRVWNVARTAAELMADMSTELCQHPNLEAYYKLNEGTANGTNTGVTTTVDHSGNGNPGTLSGFSLTGATSNWITGATLPNPSPVLQVLNQTDVACFGDSTGAATVSATGGTAPLTYLWSTGSLTASESNLAAGTYTVTVEDSQQCSNELTVTITQNSALTSTTTQTNILCFGDTAGTASVVGGGGVGPYTYTWSTGAVSDSVGGLLAGMYTVTITDSLGCQGFDTVVIEDLYDSLFVSVDNVLDVVCEGGDDGQVMVQAIGGSIPYSYLWNDPNSQIFANAINLTEGTYLVVVTDGNGCTASTQVTVGFQNASPTVDLGPDVNSNQSSETLTAPAGFASYEWSTGATSSSITVAQSGTYTVTVTDDNGCTGTDEIEVTLNPGGTGIDQPDALDHIVLFPNPTTGWITLEFETPQQRYAVLNMAGQVLLQGSLQGVSQQAVNLSKLPAGLYFLRVEGQNSSIQFLKLQRL